MRFLHRNLPFLMDYVVKNTTDPPYNLQILFFHLQCQRFHVSKKISTYYFF